MMLRACCTKRAPSSVRAIPVGLRLNRETPSSTSSCCSAVVTADWETLRAIAASETCPASTVARKCLTCLKLRRICFSDNGYRELLFYNKSKPTQRHRHRRDRLQKAARSSVVTTINCDMGEAFGLYRMGDDQALMPLVSLANVACGFHASDFNHMRKTVQLAKQHKVKVGAHPSLPDLQGFGRREMKIDRDELTNCLLYQIGALKAFLDAEGLPLNHIKPHGALYGMAARNENIAEAVADAADVYKVPLLGMKGTLHQMVYERRGHT